MRGDEEASREEGEDATARDDRRTKVTFRSRRAPASEEETKDNFYPRRTPTDAGEGGERESNGRAIRGNTRVLLGSRAPTSRAIARSGHL